VAATVVVTGAAKGIGAACAAAFIDAGWSLVAVDRDAQALEAACAPFGKAAIALAGDVSDRRTNDTAVRQAIERFGRLDAVVGNAGVNLPKLIDDTSDAEFDRLVAVNIKALFYLAQAAHRALAGSRGCFTVIA